MIEATQLTKKNGHINICICNIWPIKTMKNTLENWSLNKGRLIYDFRMRFEKMQ